MNQQPLGKQSNLAAKLSHLQVIIQSGHFEAPALINKLERFSLSLFSYFSLEMCWFKVMLQRDECTDRERKQINELSDQSCKITQQITRFICTQFHDSADGCTSAVSWADLQRELITILEEVETRLLGEQGGSSPLFHLNRPCC